jgi:FtsP/CotA-like multicopper oxidase with cupredoxin domain
MVGANRVDLLVKAPGTIGRYTLQVVDSVLASPPAGSNGVALLTVNVTGTKVEPSMNFIDKEHFPNFPEFLKDIPKGDVSKTRELVFDTTPGLGRSGGDAPGDLPLHTIDGQLFSKNISQSMVLNAVEEWTLVNKAVGIAHPFHIHINPFQAVEVFDPNSEKATKVGGPCYADPRDPQTWEPKPRNPSCPALEAPFIWWDTLAIPSARDTDFLTDPEVECIQDRSADGKYVCADPRGNACKSRGGKQWCTVKIPGYFKMRSRFADFPGVFVQHCHILAHEDRGMMQLIEILPKGVDLPKGKNVRETKVEGIPTHD